MKSLLNYFERNFNRIDSISPDEDRIEKINRLNRNERKQLRNQLFERAKQFETTKSSEQIIHWLQQCFFQIDKYSFSFNKVYFSPGHEIKNAIKKLLIQAHSSINLCVFTITDYELASLIISKYKQHIKIRIITDDEKTIAKGSEIFRLEDAGIAIKTDHSHYHMHNKFGIIDNRVAITGSFNWTYTATKHNQENMLATSNYKIVKQYQEEFNRLWTEMYSI